MVIMKLDDIRPALRQRLEHYAQERSRIEGELQELERAEMLVHNLLEEEEARFTQGVPVRTARGNAEEISLAAGRTPLAAFLLEELRDGTPRDLSELVAAATRRGLQFGKRSPGRSLHFALTGMAQNGLVERNRDQGTWQIIGVHAANGHGS